MGNGKQLEIIPLGGLGEFGMNLMVYRYGSDCVVIDAGMMFPGPEHLGVDVVIPDLDFLDECGTLHGVVLTHGRPPRPAAPIVYDVAFATKFLLLILIFSMVQKFGQIVIQTRLLNESNKSYYKEHKRF